MDENEVISPLAQVAPPAPVAAPVAAPPALAARPEPSEYEKAQAEYQRQRQSLIQQQQALIASLEARVGGPQDMMLALAAGFGKRAPTFSEGLGNAMGAFGAQQAQSRQAMSDIAKMRMELAAQQAGMAKEDIELARNRQLSNTLSSVLSGNMSPSAASAAGIPAEQASVIAQMPAEYRAMVLAQLQTGDVKGAISELNKFMLEASKKPEKVKEFEYYTAQLKSPAARSAAQQLIANNIILGSPADRSRAIIEIRKAIDEGVMPANEGQLMIQGMTSIGGSAEAPAATPSAPAASPAAPVATPSSMRIPPEVQADRDRIAKEIRDREPTGAGIPTANVVPGSTAGLSPRQQRDIAAEGAKVTATKTAESIAADRESIKQNAQKATRIVSDANSVFDLASKNPAAFGILSKPGMANAFLTLVENGIRFGNFSVGLNDVQSAILRAGGTQQDIDASAALMQLAVQTSLDLSAAVKGAVSNYEQDLFKQASFSKNDTPLVLKYKAELARARGEFDKFVWNKYLQFEKNQGGNIEQFKTTPEYSSYVKQYESALRGIRNTYFR